jgi:type I restriction enzyme, S subunit
MSFPKYNTYKGSGVEWLGDVPSHWETTRVMRLFEIKKRIVGTLGFDVLSITQQGLKVKDTERNDGQLSMDYSKYQLVEPGDFAMNQMDLLTGYVDIARTRGVTSPDYRVFSLRHPTRCFDRYYLYLLQNCYRSKIFYAFGQGASQLGRWRLPTDQFKSFLFPQPPLQEQLQIAAFLDNETAKIDVLAEEQQRLIELLKEKRQAVISHAVTKGLDPNSPIKHSAVKWLGEVPKYWNIQPIKRLISTSTSGPRGWSEMTADEGAVFFQSQNIGLAMDIVLSDAKRVNPPLDAEAQRAQLQTHDVVVCITGARTGAIAHVRNLIETTYINQHVCLLRPIPREVNGRYLAYSLSSYAGQRQLGAAMYGMKQGLGLEDLRNQVVPSPSLAEQSVIVAFLDDETARFANLITEAEAAIALLQERRSALISAAVTGKIDVRRFVPAKAEAA